MNTNIQTTGIEILDGEALDMGNGSFMLVQQCELHGPQTVMIEEADLRRLLATLG